MTDRQPTAPGRPTRRFSARWSRQCYHEIDRYLYQGEHQVLPLVRGNTTYHLDGVGTNGLAVTAEAEVLRLTDEEIRLLARYAVDHTPTTIQKEGARQE